MTTRPAPARDRLLDAADDLMFGVGVGATPVDALLYRAHVAPATMYAHFGSKDGLLAAALDRRLGEWQEWWAQHVRSAQTPREELLAVFGALAAFSSDDRGARWCAFLGTAAEQPQPSDAVADALRRDTDVLRTTLRALAVPVVGDRADVVAEQLLVVVSGALAMRLRDAGEREPWDTAREVAAACLGPEPG